MEKFSSLNNLAEHVAQHQCVTITLGDLRSLCSISAVALPAEAQRIVGAQLAELGLHHYPFNLPSSPWGYVRILAHRSDLSRVLERILRPTPETDDLVRNLVSDKRKVPFRSEKRAIEDMKASIKALERCYTFAEENVDKRPDMEVEADSGKSLKAVR